MIVAIVGIVHRDDLLPYYLEHYRELGVDRFVISCDADDLDPAGGLKRKLVTEPDVELVDLPSRFRRSKLVGMINEEIRSRLVSADDWVVPADLDELNQYPANLSELVDQLSDSGSSYMSGRLRDRLAEDGTLKKLAPFEEGVSIWEQYPLEADVTARIAGGQTEKVLLFRGDLPLSMGHHRLRDGENVKAFIARGVAHHFKWREGLDEILAWRIENEGPARVPWIRESALLTDYLKKHGRVVPGDVDAVPGWNPKLMNKVNSAVIK
jgi:hypothetical protein